MKLDGHSSIGGDTTQYHSFQNQSSTDIRINTNGVHLLTSLKPPHLLMLFLYPFRHDDNSFTAPMETSAEGIAKVTGRPLNSTRTLLHRLVNSGYLVGKKYRIEGHPSQWKCRSYVLSEEGHRMTALLMESIRDFNRNMVLMALEDISNQNQKADTEESDGN